MLSITLASCNSDELLDKDPYDRVLTENLITDFTSFEAATAGAYNLLQQDKWSYNCSKRDICLYVSLSLLLVFFDFPTYL